MRLASLFSAPTSTSNEDGLGSLRANPESCVRICGPDPVLLKRLSKRDEIERVVRIVDDLLDGKWFAQEVEPVEPGQIGIIYPRLRKEDRTIVEELRAILQNNRHRSAVVWLTENSGSRRRIGEPGIKILTMHGSKGLQFKAVILLFAHECPAHFEDTDEMDERRLFYVAITRAEEYLAVSSSKESKFLQEIESAAAASFAATVA